MFRAPSTLIIVLYALTCLLSIGGTIAIFTIFRDQKKYIFIAIPILIAVSLCCISTPTLYGNLIERPAKTPWSFQPTENSVSTSSPSNLHVITATPQQQEVLSDPQDYISDEYIYCDTSGQYYIAGHVTNTSQHPIQITASGKFPGFATNSSYYISGSIVVPPGTSRFSEPIGSAYTEIGAEGEVFEIYCDFSDFEYEWAD